MIDCGTLIIRKDKKNFLSHFYLILILYLTWIPEMPNVDIFPHIPNHHFTLRNAKGRENKREANPKKNWSY